MQIIKPQTLGLSFRPMAFRKRFGLSVSGYLHVPFAQPAQGCLWGEQSMWNFLGAEMAVPLIDEGIAKLTPEFLVHGKAFAAPERPEAVAVRARLGGTSKTLLAFGERYWDGDAPSAPAPMQPLALDWSNAYGGADFAENPSGQRTMNPTASSRRCSRRPRRAAATNSSDAATALRAGSSSPCPLSVNVTERRSRTKSSAPSSPSSLRICWLSAGCETYNAAAARPKWSSSATARK